MIPVAALATIPIQSEARRMKVFYAKTDTVGWDVVLRGTVQSIGTNIDIPPGDLSQTVQDKSKATIRFSDAFGIKPGDTLYVVNENNLIIAKVIVRQVFKSQSFGHMAVGVGNLRLARASDRVVQKVDEEYSKYAFIYKSRGDYFRHYGKIGEAIEQYKRAIEIDRRNPEAHLALGMIYLQKDLLQFAKKEFDEGYREIRRMYDAEDRYHLLKGMVETRYRSLSYASVPLASRKTHKIEAIKYAKEALSLHPSAKEMHYLIGLIYITKPEPMDVEAKNAFLKAIELDPELTDALVHLSVLYQRHNNNDKARLYANRALEVDPTNQRARYVLKSIESK